MRCVNWSYRASGGCWRAGRWGRPGPRLLNAWVFACLAVMACAGSGCQRADTTGPVSPDRKGEAIAAVPDELTEAFLEYCRQHPNGMRPTPAHALFPITGSWADEGDNSIWAAEGYMDERGAVVLPPVCSIVWDVLGGHWAQDPKTALWPVSAGDWDGYVNHQGQIEIMPRFDMAMPFIDGLGLGPVLFGGKRDGGTDEFHRPVGSRWGFINRAGEFVIEPLYTGYMSSWQPKNTEGLLAVAVGGEALPDGEWRNQKWGFIDQRGNVVVPFRYDDALSFRDGLASVGVHVPEAVSPRVGDDRLTRGDDP